MQAFNARTQQLEDVEWSVDRNGEIVATFDDESFLKFPGDTTQSELTKLLKRHQKANEGQEIITPEMEAKQAKAREAAERMAEKLNGGTPDEGDKTNAPEEDTEAAPEG